MTDQISDLLCDCEVDVDKSLAPLVEALHWWHDRSHDGAFRMCQAEPCRNVLTGQSLDSLIGAIAPVSPGWAQLS